MSKKTDAKKSVEKGVVPVDKPLEKTSDKLVIGGNNAGLVRTVTPHGGLSREVGG